MGKIAVWGGGILSVAIVAFVALLVFRSLAGGTILPPVEVVRRSENSSSWTMSNFANSLDGEVAKAERVFEYPDQASRIVMRLTCVVSHKELTATIESYQSVPVNGSYPANPYVMDANANFYGELGANIMHPVGRIKFGTSEPAHLALYFGASNYRNVIEGSAIPFWQTSDENTGKPLASARSNLPIVIEVQNEGGTEQITVPRNDQAVDSVIAKCSDSPSMQSSVSSVVSTNAGSSYEGGRYHRLDPASDLTITRSGDTWHIDIMGAGPDRGGNTPSDCKLNADGILTGSRIVATVNTEQDEAVDHKALVVVQLTDTGAIVESADVSYCGIGSDLGGTYRLAAGSSR